MELYIHIPFCVRKCAYCDFLSAPADESRIEQYVEALEKQLVEQAASFSEEKITSVFIGGGTPSILRNHQLERMLTAVRNYFKLSSDVEITVEVNPGTITAEKAKIMVEGGVNRVSIGLQSANNKELQLLGRIHDFSQFLRSYELLRKAGLKNVNVDLMSALPGQTVESYEKTLKKVLQLHPEHISAYSLMIEEGTPFFEQYAEDERLRAAGEEPKLLPSEESERLMYEMTGDLLCSHGYERYEISNYARAGYACKHNIGYWTGEHYLGLGLGAASYINGVRFTNTRILSEYLAGDFGRRDENILSKNDRMAEFFYLGLRMTKGIQKADFFKRFGFHPTQIYGQVLSELIEQGLLVDSGSGYYLSEYGVDVSNQVLYRFLL
ncbi:MAG: radical SAM family heme chaperone HemW [bacterium]|nr:radical SAM family heme chaperone HemW [bacterium]